MDEKRLRLMIRLARYEHVTGRKNLQIRKYYMGDYLGGALIRNFFLITLGYILVLAALVLFNLDFLMDNFSYLNVRSLIVLLVIGYLVLLAIYTIIVVALNLYRYGRAKRGVAKYMKGLEQLEKMYRRADRDRASGKPRETAAAPTEER